MTVKLRTTDPKQKGEFPLEEKNIVAKRNWAKKSVYPLIKCLQGIFVGAGGILPGLSGGVLCVVFGIYQPMMELFAHPFQTWKKHLKWIIPFMIGVAIGFFGVAKALEVFFTNYEEIATCAFIGLILGTFPDLFKEGGKEGRSPAAWWVFGIGSILFLAFFEGIAFFKTELIMNIGWAFFCGCLWGVSIIVPGMSSSSVLLSMDLYDQMNTVIANFDLKYLIPMGIGMVAVILLCAHLVNKLFKSHYAIAFSVVIAAVLGSTLATVPLHYASGKRFAIDMIAIVLGAGIAYLLTILMNRLAPPESEDDSANDLA